MATVHLTPVRPFEIPHDEACRNHTFLTHIRRTAVIQLIGGCILIVLGIVATTILAYWSFFSTSIWSGILIFGLTGVIGMFASSNRNKSLIKIYLFMSILACFMGFALFEMHVFAATYEEHGRCQPGGSDSVRSCSTRKSQAARMTFDALISCTGFFLFTLPIVSASFGCGAVFKCSKPCCKKCCSLLCIAPRPVTHQGGMVSSEGQQQVPYQPGMFLVRTAPPPAMQCQEVAMPTPASTSHGETSCMMPPVAIPGTSQFGSAIQLQPSRLVSPRKSPDHTPPVDQPTLHVSGQLGPFLYY